MAQTHPIPAPAFADQRVAGILLAVRRAFAEKGFDGASMQDLARTAGMSVGNFYRYFPSKAAIVEAIITHDLQELERDFSDIIGSPDPMLRLRQTISKNGALARSTNAAVVHTAGIGISRIIASAFHHTSTARYSRSSRTPASTSGRCGFPQAARSISPRPQT